MDHSLLAVLRTRRKQLSRMKTGAGNLTTKVCEKNHDQGFDINVQRHQVGIKHFFDKCSCHPTQSNPRALILVFVSASQPHTSLNTKTTASKDF